MAGVPLSMNSTAKSLLEPDSSSGSDYSSQTEKVPSSFPNSYSQHDLDKVGQYLSKHKMVLLEKSHFSLKQVFDLLENQSKFKNIDAIIENLDQNMLNSSSSGSSSCQSSSLDFDVQTNADAHIEHTSDIDRGLPRVEDNLEANISPVTNSEDVCSENTPVPDASQSFHAEMYLLLNYIAELEQMSKIKIKVNHLLTFKNFAFKVQKYHMDFVFEHLEMQKVIAAKNDEIIALQKRVMDLTDSTVTSSTLCQNTKLDSLHGMVDKLVQKIDLSLSHNCNSNNVSDHQSSDVQHIDSKIDELRESIDKLPPTIVSLSKTFVPAVLPDPGPIESQTDQSEKNSDFDPSTHDWDNGEFVTVVKKQRGKRGSPKPLSYSDILSKPAKELNLPKISLGISEPRISKSFILLLVPAQKSEKMSNAQFLRVKARIKALVNGENRKILIDSISPTKSGGILLSFPTQKDLDATKNILTNVVNELKLSPVQPSKVLPKIEISKIDGAIPQNQIINVLLEKNPEIRKKIDSEKAVFDLVFSKKDFYSNTQTAVIKCSPSIRYALIEKGHIVIDCDRCPCQDHFFIFQCFHCASFGHSSSRCPQKSKAYLRCSFCAAKGDHDSEHCPSKANPDKHACCNCMSSSDNEIRSDAITHPANSKNCPIYLREISKLALRTDFGNDFVY